MNITYMARKYKDPALQALADEEKSQLADIDLLTKFKSGSEKRLAKTLLGKYLREFSIENVSDKNTLAQVIYLEVTNLRIQEKLNEIYSRDAKAIPQDLIKTMNDNNDTVIKLKNMLGLSKPKEKKDTYTALEDYKERHRLWRENNQATRHIKCPYPECNKFIWLKVRTEAWEAQQHPFFKDTFLYNKHLMDNLGKKVTIDMKFIAAVFGTSTNYVEKLLSKIHKGHSPSNKGHSPSDKAGNEILREDQPIIEIQPTAGLA